MELLTVEESGVRCLEGEPRRTFLRRAQAASRILEACLSARTRLVLLSADNLTPGFFDLSSGQAGEILQKLRRFEVRLAIVCPPGSGRFSSRFREILCQDLTVFDTRDAARDWLARGVSS